MKRLFIINLCRVESKICSLLLEVFRLNYSQHLNRIFEKVQRLWRDQMWNLLSHFSFGKPSWFGVSQSFWACVVMWCVSFSWQYAFFFFWIKFWTAFPAYPHQLGLSNWIFYIIYLVFETSLQFLYQTIHYIAFYSDRLNRNCDVDYSLESMCILYLFLRCISVYLLKYGR